MKKIFVLLTLLVYVFICRSQTVQPPSAVQVSDIDGSSATITWNQNDDVLFYIVSYNVVMSETITQEETFDTVLYLYDLLSATQYICRVQAVNYDLDTSDYSTLVSFYTLGYTTDCDDVTDLTVTTTNYQDVLIQFSGDEQSQYREVVCDEIGTNPETGGTRFFTNNMEQSFANLESGHTYQFAVRSHCNSSFSNWRYVYAKYIQGYPVAQLPLQITFEQEDQIKSLGFVSSPNNPWVVGTSENAETNSAEKSLYISNDNGDNAVFNNAVSSISYAYIDFEIPPQAVSFYVDFSYKANINSATDGMKVYLVSNGFGINTDQLPSDIYLVGDTLYNNTSGQWQQEHIELPSDYIGSPRRLMFVWTNSGTSSDSSSVAVDNIYITARYCAIPDSLTAENITYNSAELSWSVTENQSSYNLQYRKLNDTVWTSLENVANGYLLENLEENTEYIFRVQADCITEESFFSELDTFKTHIIALAVEDTTIQYEVTYDSAFFTWAEVENTVFYIVSYKENSFYAPWITDTVAGNSYNIGGLSPNTQYLFRIRTVNMNGDKSKYSSDVMFATLCAPVTEFPYLYSQTIDYNTQSGFVNLPACYDSLQAQMITPVFDLTDMYAAELNFDIYSTSSVIVYVSADGGQTYTQYKTIAPSQSTQISYSPQTIILSDYIMEPNVRIKFSFISIGEANTMAKIKNINIQAACAAPGNVNVSAVTTSSVSLLWSSSAQSSSWIARVYDSEDNLIKSMNTSTNSCTFSQLDSLTEYYAVIKTVCSSQESYDSSIVYFTTGGTEGITCPVPANFTAFWYPTKSDETIMATWDSSLTVNVWEVWYKDYYAMEWEQKTVTITPVFTIRNLEDGAKYEIKLRAICAPGDTSDFTQTITVTVNPSGLEETAYDGYSLLLYPNPTDGIVNIECSNRTSSTAYLINSVSQVIREYDILPLQIDMNGLPQGIYTLTGYIGGRKFSKQIIKK